MLWYVSPAHIFGFLFKASIPLLTLDTPLLCRWVVKQRAIERYGLLWIITGDINRVDNLSPAHLSWFFFFFFFRALIHDHYVIDGSLNINQWNSMNSVVLNSAHISGYFSLKCNSFVHLSDLHGVDESLGIKHFSNSNRDHDTFANLSPAHIPIFPD